jgi:predicted dinucleotide-binding enzyme
MKIAIIGTGNVGGTLAKAFNNAGHAVILGVRNPDSYKGKETLEASGLKALEIHRAVEGADLLVLATPATSAIEVAKSLGDTTGKIIIDTMNVVMGRGPEGYSNTTDAILSNTTATDVVKCFNTTGFENMADPVYQGKGIDMFVAGSSDRGKKAASQLAREIGFGAVHDMGGNDKFFLIEQLANAWINLAIFQGEGRDMAFRLVRRS